jgi:photosystem II stability/assembly factor-like uncharacterized protein
MKISDSNLNNFSKVLTMLFIALFSCLCFADFGVWHYDGPNGGYVYSLVMDPEDSNTLFASTACGLFETSDEGNNWTKTGEIFSNCPITTCLVVNPLDDQIMYAGTSCDGIYKSEDRGKNWRNIAFQAMAVNFIEIDPQNPLTLYALVVVNIVESAKLFKSYDGGLNWDDRTPSNIDYLGIYSVRVNPKDSSIVYLGVNNSFLKSSDGGIHWEKISDLSCSPFLCAIKDIQISKENPDTIFISSGLEIYKSVDGGLNWTPLGWSNLYPTMGNILSFKVDFSQNTIYLLSFMYGIYKTNDEGKNWTQIMDGEHRFASIEIGSSSIYIAGGDQSSLDPFCSGIKKSVDGGNSWSEIDNGILCSFPCSLSISKFDKKTLFLGLIMQFSQCRSSFYKSEDKGKTWIGGNLEGYEVAKIVTDGINGDKVYAIAISSYFSPALYESDDGGINWSQKKSSVISFAIDPKNSQIQYAGMSSNGALYKSTDGGNTWNELPLSNEIQTYSIIINPQKSDEIFICTSEGAFKTEDGGLNWQPFEIGGTRTIISLSFSENNPSFTFALAQDSENSFSLFGSKDGGINWTKVNSFNDSSYATISLDPSSPSVLYALVWSPQPFICTLMKSVDGGINFKPFKYRLPENGIENLLIDYENPANLYATTKVGVCSFTQPLDVFEMTKLKEPFRIKVSGEYFKEGIKVFIGNDQTAWKKVLFKSSGELIIKGGDKLKSKVPKGKEVLFRFVNPEGDESQFIFKR